MNGLVPNDLFTPVVFVLVIAWANWRFNRLDKNIDKLWAEILELIKRDSTYTQMDRK